MKKFKILHIADLHIRHFSRLFYSTGKKINNGLILNGHNVVNISDRDITNQNKNIFDIGSRKLLFNIITQNIENFKPDLIIMGHVDRINYETFYQLKEKYTSIRFSQWFLDPLNIDGPDFNKNKERFYLKYQFCDTNFITTAVDALDFVSQNKTFFIPNPIDPSIDVYRNYQSNKPIDLFLAISHGQHRGILKDHYVDDRVDLIKKLTNKVSTNIFGYKRNPVWGQKFFDELNTCSMAINLSRGKPIKHYSSDRIASLMGNGLLTFIHKDFKYNDFFTKNEIVTYKNISELNKKLIFYKKNKSLLKKIAKSGCEKAHKIFNNKIIADYIVKKTMDIKLNTKLSWFSE
jgi:hypothetical protein